MDLGFPPQVEPFENWSSAAELLSTSQNPSKLLVLMDGPIPFGVIGLVYGLIAYVILVIFYWLAMPFFWPINLILAFATCPLDKVE